MMREERSHGKRNPGGGVARAAAQILSRGSGTKPALGGGSGNRGWGRRKWVGSGKVDRI
jgi:hypothetical protein